MSFLRGEKTMYLSLPQFPFRLLSQSFLRSGRQKPVHWKQQPKIPLQYLRQIWGKQLREIVAFRVKAQVAPFQPDLLLRSS